MRLGKESSNGRRSPGDAGGVHVNFITQAVVDAEGAFVVDIRGESTSRRIDPVGATIAAAQLTEALKERLNVSGGTWTSAETLAKHVYSCSKFLAMLLEQHGVDDLASPYLTTDIVWETVLKVGHHGAAQRNLRSLLADAFPGIRDDGNDFEEVLNAGRLQTDVYRQAGYAPSVADAIEAFVKPFVAAWYTRHRSAVASALGEQRKDWLTLPAQTIIRAAEYSPVDFKVTIDDLAPAMVLLSLIDNKGPNLSVMRSYTSDSAERSNTDAGFATGMKARNKEVLRTPAPAGGLFSYLGLLEFLTAATRVDRYFRQHSDDFDRLLFVRSGGSKTIDGATVNTWWKRTLQRTQDPNPLLPPSVSFQKTRKAAALRARREGQDVIGHGPAMKRVYSADAVPDVIAVPLLLQTQATVAEQWRGRIAGLAEGGTAEPSTAAEEAAAEAIGSAKAIMDVGVAACITNGQAPDNQDLPCGLGPVACFTCPKGFRTPEVIPGLIGAVQFTDNIRKYDPAEWIDGHAAKLNVLAQKSLAQFPRHLVESALPIAIDTGRVLVACAYSETRTNA